MKEAPSTLAVCRLGKEDARKLFQIASESLRERIADHEIEIVRAEAFSDQPIPCSLAQVRERSAEAGESRKELLRLRRMLDIVVWSMDALAQKTPEDFGYAFGEILKEPQ